MSQDTTKAKNMFASYSQAMLATGALLDDSFSKAVDLISSLDSILIITGLGKSGLVGQKAAATFSSTGTQSAFVHPVEALHGDLGIVQPKSALLAISKSGGNEETIEFARQFKSVTFGQLITLTEPASQLGSIADVALTIPQLPEIDEFDLAPTTSTLTSLGVCDVLAICVQQRKGLTERDFAQFHPSGALGRRLLLQVRDLMIHEEDVPTIAPSATFAELIYEISSKALGMVVLINATKDYIGVITDGDIRRLLSRKQPLHDMNAQSCFELSRRGPDGGPDEPVIVHGSVTPDTKAIDCLRGMQESRITAQVILDGSRLIGLVRMRDLLGAGI